MRNDTPRSARQLLALLGAALATSLAGCGGGGTFQPPGGTYFFGSQLLGQGDIRTFITLDNSQNPQATGVRLSEAALSGLPGTTSVIDLELPPQATKVPFTFVEIRYWPQGPVPAGPSNVEYFEIMPFLITSTQRDAITATGADLANVLKTPAASAVASGFVQVPSTDAFFAEPRFGTRFYDPTSPVALSPFTRAVFYGYYNGQMDFMEFAVAKSLLASKTATTDTIKLPATLPKPGYYPTRFGISFDASSRIYTISLGNMVLR